MISSIETKNLIKRFGYVIALDGLNLEIRGDISGFVGPNGAGKTTTIKCLIGLIQQFQGDAYVLGFDARKDSLEIRKRVGILQENFVFPKDMTAERFLEHVAHFKKIRDIDKAIPEILRKMNLEKAKNRAIGGFSAGMKRRLGLAQALIGEPEYIILDEPTANLDPIGRREILDLILEMHNDHNVRFLISSHVLLELEKIIDWVSIINKGKIIEQGYVNELKQRYQKNILIVKVDKLQTLKSFLEKFDDIKVQEINNSLYITYDDLNSLQDTIVKIVYEEKLHLNELRVAESTLEDVFFGGIQQ